MKSRNGTADPGQSPYDALASVYDLLQEDIGLSEQIDYIQRMESEYGRIGAGDGLDGRRLALDLGCGTGKAAVELVRRGYDVIGIDQSRDMLSKARSIAEDNGIGHGAGGVTLVCQDISDFELYGTVDLILCLLDTVNHLVEPAQVRQFLARCHHYLNPGGLFLFDLATPRHFSDTRGDQLFYDLSPDVTMFWKNTFDPDSGVSDAEITLFTQGTDGRYERQDTEVREKAYPVEQVCAWARETGFEIAAVHMDTAGTPATEEADRVYIALVHPKT